MQCINQQPGRRRHLCVLSAQSRRVRHQKLVSCVLDEAKRALEAELEEFTLRELRSRGECENVGRVLST